jgi:hypothetical protein
MSKNSSRMVVAKWGRNGWLAFALMFVIIAGVACGSGRVSQFSTPIPTEINTATPILPTDTPLPTSTLLPTLTATPDPAQIFADTVLAQIAGRSPDYQDDFSNPSSGWETGRQDDDKIFVGTREYVDGQYVTIADPATDYSMKKYGFGYVNGSNARLVSNLKNYVFEVEQIWITGSGFAMINLHDSDGFAFSIRLSRPGRNGGFWLERNDGPETATQFSNDILFPSVATGQSTTRITFITLGQEFAILANGQPIYYSNLSGERKLNLYTIEFRLLTDSSVNPVEVHWDNLKIWDLNR